MWCESQRYWKSSCHSRCSAQTAKGTNVAAQQVPIVVRRGEWRSKKGHVAPSRVRGYRKRNVIDSMVVCAQVVGRGRLRRNTQKKKTTKARTQGETQEFMREEEHWQETIGLAAWRNLHRSVGLAAKNHWQQAAGLQARDGGSGTMEWVCKERTGKNGRRAGPVIHYQSAVEKSW